MNSSALTNTHQQQDEAQDSSSIQQQQYPYYPSNYTNYYNQPQSEQPNSIHPPGVPIQPDPSTHLALPDYGSTQFQNQQSGYYPYGVVAEQNQWFGQMMPVLDNNPMIGQSSSRGRGRRGSKSSRGRGGRGHIGPHVFQLPPPVLAWCELCRVDCNSLEKLEQHKNGKKHKKNMQVHQELQNLNQVITEMQNYQAPFISESNPEAVLELEKQPQMENLPFEITLTGQPNEGEKKRNMAGGPKGNKRLKRSAVPKIPKQAVHLFCEVCNVKCESQVVFDSHLAGKKHQTNLKRSHARIQPHAIPQVHALASRSTVVSVPEAVPNPILETDDPNSLQYGSQPTAEASNETAADTEEADKIRHELSFVNGGTETETEKETVTPLEDISGKVATTL